MKPEGDTSVSPTVGWHVKHAPCNFQKIAEEAAVIGFALELRMHKARVVRAATKTYLHIRQSQPYANGPSCNTCALGGWLHTFSKNAISGDAR